MVHLGATQGLSGVRSLTVTSGPGPGGLLWVGQWLCSGAPSPRWPDRPQSLLGGRLESRRMCGQTLGALLPGDRCCLGHRRALDGGHAAVLSPASVHHDASHAGSARGEIRVLFSFYFKSLSLLEEGETAVGSNKTSVYPDRSSTVTLSCQGPVAQSPISKLSGLMSVLSLVVHKAGCSKRLEGPSPLQAAGKEPTLGVSLLWPRSPWWVGKEPGFSFHCSVHGARGLVREALSWAWSTAGCPHVMYLTLRAWRYRQPRGVTTPPPPPKQKGQWRI